MAIPRCHWEVSAANEIGGLLLIVGLTRSFQYKIYHSGIQYGYKDTPKVHEDTVVYSQSESKHIPYVLGSFNSYKTLLLILSIFHLFLHQFYTKSMISGSYIDHTVMKEQDTKITKEYTC